MRLPWKKADVALLASAFSLHLAKRSELAYAVPMTNTVVITGASRGIGRAIATRFLRASWTVRALVRTPSQVDDLKSLGEITALPFDAADSTSVLKSCEQVLALGVPSVLINNAGIALSASLAKTSLEDFQRIQAINVTAPFLLSRELSGPMAKGGTGGRIINIASTAAKKGFKYTSAYCASKHALLGLTRALAVELASKKITVNAVCPGWTDTDMFKASVDRIASSTGRNAQDARTALESMSSLGRAVQPEEVAELVFFLATSPAAAAITGADYGIDGGETA